MVRRFLEVSARAHERTAQAPGEAADALLKIVTAEEPDLPTPLDEDVVRESMDIVAKVSDSSWALWPRYSIREPAWPHCRAVFRHSHSQNAEGGGCRGGSLPVFRLVTCAFVLPRRTFWAPVASGE